MVAKETSISTMAREAVNCGKLEIEFMTNTPEIMTTTGGNPIADNQNSSPPARAARC